MNNSFQISTDNGTNWEDIVCSNDDSYNYKQTMTYLGKHEEGLAVFITSLGETIYTEWKDFLVEGKVYEYEFYSTK